MAQGGVNDQGAPEGHSGKNPPVQPDLRQPLAESPEHEPQGSIARQAAHGVLWMTAQSWLARAGGLVTVAILSRLLAPEAFGVLAVATTLLTFTYVLSDLGLSTYVVQAPQISTRTLSTAFWVSLLGGIVLALAIFFGASPLAHLLRVPEATPVIESMVIVVVLITLTSVPIALLRRRMAFRTLALQASGAAILAQVAAVGAAFGGLGVWALVLQLVVGQLVSTVAAWITARWRPTLEFSGPEFRVMTGFGINVVGSGLVGVGRTWAETAVITAGLGVRDLGFWSIAQRLVTTATDLSGSAILPVSTTAFAKVNSSAERLHRAHAKATGVAQTVVTPLMVFIIVTAPVLVPFVFGSRWGTSATIAGPLAAAAALSFGTAVDRGMFDGAGHPGRWFVFSTGIAALSVVLTAGTVREGMLLVAYAYVVTASVETIGRWILVSRFLSVGVRSTARPFLNVMPSAAVGALVGVAAMTLLGGGNAVLVLAVTGLLVMSVYLAMTWLTNRTAWEQIIVLTPVRRRLGREP